MRSDIRQDRPTADMTKPTIDVVVTSLVIPGLVVSMRLATVPARLAGAAGAGTTTPVSKPGCGARSRLVGRVVKVGPTIC